MRRQLMWGAIVGLVLGVAAQFAISSAPHSELVGLVRAAMFLPVVCFMVWWFAFPGINLDSDDVADVTDMTATIDVDARLQRIEDAFDAAAVPSARHHAFDVEDEAQRTRFRASIRRSESSIESSTFGVRRPAEDSSTVRRLAE